MSLPEPITPLPNPNAPLTGQGAPLPVSVVVPLYNKAPYIERALTSILSQTRHAEEIIVIDDGSTDEGPQRVLALGHPNIRLIQQDNQGPGAARNCGIAVARSAYVAFLDADDEWLPSFLERAVSKLEAHPDCALTVCGHLRGPNRTPWTDHFRQAGIQSGVWRLPLTLSPQHYKTNLDFLFSSAMVCKRSVIQELGGFYSKNGCNYGEDIYLWLQVILNYPIYRHLEPLLWYHTEDSGLAVWKRSTCPPWPMLLDPLPIRRRCPPAYQNTLERILTHYALIAAYRASTQGESATVQKLLSAFPETLDSSDRIQRIRLELLVSSIPGLRPALRQLKRRFQSTR